MSSRPKRRRRRRPRSSRFFQHRSRRAVRRAALHRSGLAPGGHIGHSMAGDAPHGRVGRPRMLQPGRASRQTGIRPVRGRYARRTQADPRSAGPPFERSGLTPGGRIGHSMAGDAPHGRVGRSRTPQPGRASRRTGIRPVRGRYARRTQADPRNALDSTSRECARRRRRVALGCSLAKARRLTLRGAVPYTPSSVSRVRDAFVCARSGHLR